MHSPYSTMLSSSATKSRRRIFSHNLLSKSNNYDNHHTTNTTTTTTTNTTHTHSHTYTLTTRLWKCPIWSPLKTPSALTNVQSAPRRCSTFDVRRRRKLHHNRFFLFFSSSCLAQVHTQSFMPLAAISSCCQPESLSLSLPMSMLRSPLPSSKSNTIKL